MSQCPECQKDDRARKISGILDQGTSTTKSETYSYDADDKGIERLSYDEEHFTESESKTNLVKRLEGRLPKEPKGPGNAALGCGCGFAVFGVVPLLMSATMSENLRQGVNMFLVAAGVLIIFGILRKVTGSSAFKARQTEYAKAKEQLLTSWYCERCDLVFAPKKKK